ncbi:MAG: chromosome segregation protein SMC [Roseburia sp.]|nr:chromosome segregation protein SMC [Roseburia sp.]
MKFKKLSMIGFKSFADKLDVKFGEGITAIVGPNGCGKSNVADAVRWVLGEQSAKLLRGPSMQAVIFNGTERRHSLSYAEVSLTFDNKNKSLFPSCDYEEVVIARKLFRSGQSEYFINGSVCRLRDISDLMRDAGFALDGYTIIGQGMVTDLINSKPEDRREIFEEAAGISKYKFRKKEAERKNEKTRANLTRIDDAMKIQSEQLEPLAKQAEKARRYFDLKEKLKYHEINTYINKYETAAETKAQLSTEISDIEVQIADLQAKYDNAASEYNNATETLRSIDANIESFRKELMELAVDKEKTYGQVRLHMQQIDNLNRQSESLKEMNSRLSENYRNITVSVEQKQDEFNRKTEMLGVGTAEYEALNAKYTELSEKVKAEEERIERERKALLEAMEHRAAVSQSLGELTAERAAANAQLERAKKLLEERRETLAAVSEARERIAEELQKLAREKQELSATKEATIVKNDECERRIKELDASLVEVKQSHSGLATRQKMLIDLQRSMEGYAVPVRRLLNDAKDNEKLKNAVLGVVGQIITVKEGFETAIEMALGSAVSNIVTRDEGDAQFLIEHLKANKYGRATFLPLTSFKSRELDAGHRPLLARNGCFGVASGVVACDPMFDTVIGGLLGGTVVVDNIDTAVRLAKDSSYAFRIVTLDGDIVYPHGSISGGSKKAESLNVFAYERELKENAAHIDELDSRIKSMQSERETLAHENVENINYLRALSKDIHEYDLAEASKNTEYAAYIDEADSLERSVESDESAVRMIASRIEAIAADLDAVEKTQDDIAPEVREEDDKSRKEFELLRAECDKLRESVSERNVQNLKLNMDLNTLKNDIARLKSEMVYTSKRIEENDMAILDNNRKTQGLNDKISELSGSGSSGNDARREELGAKLDDLSKYKEDLNNKAVETDKSRLAISDEIGKLTEKKYEKSGKLNSVDLDMDALQSRVSEEYELSYEQCLQYKDENYDPENGNIEMGKLRRNIANLGNVNQNAVEESQELLKKYHDMELQRDDIVKSLAGEEQVINEISEKMAQDFNACFEKIRANFREIFKDLFEGGSADLELTENEDPLLCGVEIKAQPPGKNIQTLSQMSGGEKTLTAIAILFAILKLRPMPFCLLDEIEAALDDANTDRVATALKKFSAATQLIVITHRKPTMEKADCLYGVIMEEPGVSKIVSVRLSEAIKSAVSIPAEQH